MMTSTRAPARHLILLPRVQILSSRGPYPKGQAFQLPFSLMTQNHDVSVYRVLRWALGQTCLGLFWWGEGGVGSEVGEIMGPES